MAIDQKRLERIEEKLDKLGEAFVIMARVEEKIVNIEQARIETNKRYDERITHILGEIKEIREKQVEQDTAISDNSRVTGYIRWIVGAVITAVIGAVALQLFA